MSCKYHIGSRIERTQYLNYTLPANKNHSKQDQPIIDADVRASHAEAAVESQTDGNDTQDDEGSSGSNEAGVAVRIHPRNRSNATRAVEDFV